MANKIMRVGGKSPSNTAVGIAVDANGAVFQKHIWETEIVNVATMIQARDTTAVTYPAGDAVSLVGYAVVGLRVINNTDQPLNITLTDGNNYIGTLEQATVILQIPSGGRSTIITADDVPCLNIINQLKFKCQFSTAPTEGFFDIKVIKKR